MLLPKKVGSFTLMRTLGADGLMESFVGILDDPAGKQMVARRVLPQVARDAQRLNELRVRVGDLRACKHPTLVPLLDFVEVDGEHYILEDWVDTVTLRDMLTHHRAAGTALPHNVYLNLATQICNGLEALHGRPGSESGAANVLHMGISPEAVHVGHDGQVMIGAYGMVRSPTALPHTGTNSFGTAMEYLAPEQTHQDQALSPASDIFALGAVLYELLTLRPMFRAESPLQTIHRIRRAEVTTQLLEVKEILPGLDRVLYRALSLNPRHRYQRAFVLREDLRGLMAGYTFADIEAVTREALAPVFRFRSEGGSTDEIGNTSPEGPGETTAALMGGIGPSVFDSDHETDLDLGAGGQLDQADSLGAPLETDAAGDVEIFEDGDTMDSQGEHTGWIPQQGGFDEDGGETDMRRLPGAPPAATIESAGGDLSASPRGARTVELPDAAVPLGDQARSPSPAARAESAPTRETWGEAPSDEGGVPGVGTVELIGQVPELQDALTDDVAPLPEVEPARRTPVPSPRGRDDDEAEEATSNWIMLGGAGAALLVAVLAITCFGVGGVGLLSNATGKQGAQAALIPDDPSPTTAAQVEPPRPPRAAPEHDDLEPTTAAAVQPQPRAQPVPRAQPEPRVQPRPRVQPEPRARPEPRVQPTPPPAPIATAAVAPTPPPAPQSPAPAPVASQPTDDVLDDLFDDIAPPEPASAAGTFHAVAAIESRPSPAAAPQRPISGAELEAASAAAFSGSLDPEVGARLSEVPGEDPGFTRARTLLFLDAKARNDTGARDAHLAALMAIPANRYNPALLVEEAAVAMGREDWSKAIERAALAERHWARLPPDLIFSRKAMMFEIQAQAATGSFYESEGDNLDSLNQAIRGWEKYRHHVGTKSRSELVTRADEHLDRLYEIQRRLE